MPYASLDDAVRAEVDETLEHFNANHADTVLLLARFAAGVPEVSDAEAVTVDAEGLEFDIVAGARRTSARLAFPAPVATAADVSLAVLARLGEARAAVGDRSPITSLERELTEQAAIPTATAEVVRAGDLTANLREVVVGGPGLAGYRSVGGDQFVYVLVARPGEVLPATYSMAEWMAADPQTRPLGAYYTVRSWDVAAGEMTLWAVVHGHDHGVGAWLATCAPGDRLALWGPRAGFGGDGAYARTGHDSRHHLFVTDESGFCAVAALLDELPRGDSATVLAETVDPDHQVPFPGDRTNVRWHYRGDAEPGTGSGLYDLVVELVDRLGPGVLATAFGAGESRQITRIRKYLRQTCGMPATHVSMTGYWRRRA